MSRLIKILFNFVFYFLDNLIILCPALLGIALAIYIRMGSPIVFTQHEINYYLG